MYILCFIGQQLSRRQWWSWGTSKPPRWTCRTSMVCIEYSWWNIFLWYNNCLILKFSRLIWVHSRLIYNFSWYSWYGLHIHMICVSTFSFKILIPWTFVQRDMIKIFNPTSPPSNLGENSKFDNLKEALEWGIRETVCWCW